MIVKFNQQVASLWNASPTILELRAAALVICELWATIQPVCKLWAVSYYMSVDIISSMHVQQSKRYTPESKRKIYCDLNGNELEKYESIYATID